MQDQYGTHVKRQTLFVWKGFNFQSLGQFCVLTADQQSGRSVNLRTPCCHRKEWRPLARLNAISCYNSDLATKLRRRSASLYIGYLSRERVGRWSTWSAVRINVQKENAVCNFLLRSRCSEGPCASFHQKKFLVHQRVLKKSGLSQTESDETMPVSWSVRFCF